MRILLSSIILVSSLLAYGEPAPHIVDQAHSQINFVAHARLISCHGFFGRWEIDARVNSEKPEESTIKVTIDASSINTRIQRRDDHLRSEDFFWVEKHPEIIFASKKITSRGGNQFAVHGDMTIRGVTKEVEIPATMVFYENNRGRFTGTFNLNRKEFGINFDSPMNSIQDMVDVQFDINLLDREAAERARQQRQRSN